MRRCDIRHNGIIHQTSRHLSKCYTCVAAAGNKQYYRMNGVTYRCHRELTRLHNDCSGQNPSHGEDNRRVTFHCRCRPSDSTILVLCFRRSSCEDTVLISCIITIQRVREKSNVIFNYNSRISWSIFLIFVPLETGTNSLEQYVIYLLKCFITS